MFGMYVPFNSLWCQRSALTGFWWCHRGAGVVKNLGGDYLSFLIGIRFRLHIYNCLFECLKKAFKIIFTNSVHLINLLTRKQETSEIWLFYQYRRYGYLFLFVFLQYCEKFERYTICEIISCFVLIETGLFLLIRKFK